MEYILNTKIEKLYEVPCTNGETPNEAVKAGDRKHYSSIANAQNDPTYKACYINEYCISKDEC